MLKIRSNAGDISRRLDRAGKALPTAMRNALNDTARKIAGHLANNLPRFIDRPTPFTMRAFNTQRATKTDLKAFVFVKPKQAEYLKYQIEGGTRRPKNRAILVPTRLRLNRYGNIPRGRIARLLARPDTFSGTINGVPGIWQRSPGRKRSGLRLLVAYEGSATYQSIFPMQSLAEDQFRYSWPIESRKSLRITLARLRV